MNFFDFTNIKDFIFRNIAWIFVAILGLLFLGIVLPVVQSILQAVGTLLVAVFAEAVAIALSSFAAYAYTEIKFTKESYTLTSKDNPNYDPIVRAAKIKVLGYIVLSVHLLVGLTIFGVYLGMFYN